MAKIVEDVEFVGKSFEGVAKVGRTLIEGAKEYYEQAQKKAELLGGEPIKYVPEKVKPLVEAYQRMQEDLTLANNTALYTTMVAGFIERALRPKLVAQNVIKSIDMNLKGTEAIKIPKGKLLTAADLPDSGDITYASSADYEAETINITWKYAAQKITHALLQHANVDLIAEQLYEIGYALSRKMDSDIIAAMDSATTGSNGNAVALGSGTYIDYSAVVDAKAAMEENYAEPKVFLTNPTTWARLMKDSDVKQALQFGTVPSAGSVFPMVQTMFGMQVVVSPEVPADTSFLIDTDYNGYLVKGTNVQTFDGRINGTLAYEVIGAIAYGVGIVRPEAVYKIKENADSV